MTTPSVNIESSVRLARPRGISALRSAWALYALCLRQHRHGRRWIIMAVLLMLPILLAILSRVTDPSVAGRALEFNLVFMFIPQGLLPLLALVYASGIIHDEQEEQTITYLLIRPIPKWLLYLGKLAAAITAAVALAVLSTALTYVAIYAGAPHWPAIMARGLAACCVHTLAVAAYCCLFGLLGLLTRRVLVAGIIYIALVEGLLANLPFAIRLITVIYYTRLIAYRMLPFVVSTPWGRRNFAADAWQLSTHHHPNLPNYLSTGVCLLVLLAGSVVCTALAVWLCQGREFYVKTPEKT